MTQRAWWVPALLLALTGCASAAAAAPPPAPTPASTPVDCTADAPPRLTSLLGLLAGGQTLEPALEQVYGTTIRGLPAEEQSDALSVLAGLDSCPTVPSQDKSDVPRLVRLIALGAPNVEPATVPPPPQSGP